LLHVDAPQNDAYDSSMLTKFNAMFPAGTTFVLKQNCTNGFNKAGACGSLPTQPRDSLAFETGFMDVDFEPKTFRMHSFKRRGSGGSGGSSSRSPTANSAFHTGISTAGEAAAPAWSALNLSVTLGDGNTYHCTGLNDYVTDYGLQFPVRVVKDGRFHSHVDLLGLTFRQGGSAAAAASEGVENTAITGYAEIFVWPRCFGITAEISHSTAAVTTTMAMSLDGGTAVTSSVAAGEGGTATVSLRFCVDDSTGKLEHVTAAAAAVATAGPQALEVGFRSGGGVSAYDSMRSSWKMTLPAAGNKVFPASLDSSNDWDISLGNPTAQPTVLNLEFFRFRQRNIVGITPMLLLPDGSPSGLPLQVSKNWHEGHPLSWLSVSTACMLPPNSTTLLTLRVVFAHWGGLPSVSHAQLCLIGWGGGHQVWHESALGSFGENFVYQPDGGSRRSKVTDVRPMSVCNMDSTTSNCKKYRWTENVG
jgi:hypothetical protein